MVLRYKDIHAFDNYKTMQIIYSMYRVGEVSVHQACCKRATQPYSLEGGGTIYPGSRPAGVTTRSPRMVTECLLTRSMLTKMYLPFHGIWFWFDFCFTALQHILCHFGCGQSTYPHCSWASLLGSLPVLSAHSFASNWQLLFLNQRKSENGRRNVFVAKSPWKNVPISWYVPVYVHCIYSQSISCRRSLKSICLSNCINGFVSLVKYLSVMWKQSFQKDEIHSDHVLCIFLSVLYLLHNVNNQLESYKSWLTIRMVPNPTYIYLHVLHALDMYNTSRITELFVVRLVDSETFTVWYGEVKDIKIIIICNVWWIDSKTSGFLSNSFKFGPNAIIGYPGQDLNHQYNFKLHM